MSESPDPTPADLNRQLRQHLDSLRAAGVHWLPANPPSPPPLVAGEPEPRAEAKIQPSLFAPASEPPTQGDLEQRRHELTVLAERVSGCQRCRELVVSR